MQDRDWYRESPKRSWRRRISILTLWVAIPILLAIMLQLGTKLRSEPDSSKVKLTILPGLPEVTIREGLYADDDPWKDYLAGEDVCPGGEKTDVRLDIQADTLVCLVNYAREKRGLAPVGVAPLLNETALSKARKIVRCGDFDHDACGEDPATDARAAGYQGPWGENLYLGERGAGAPRVAMDGWLNSPEHRENLFRGEWRSQGIAAIKVKDFTGYSDVTIWVNQFATD